MVLSLLTLPILSVIHLSAFVHHFVLTKLATSSIRVNVHRTISEKYLTIIQTMPCWHSLESSCQVLSDEYQYARVSAMFQFLSNNIVFLQACIIKLIILKYSLSLTIMLLVANLANTKWCKIPENDWNWEMGTHLRVLSVSFPTNTNLTGFRLFSKIFASLCFGRKWS